MTRSNCDCMACPLVEKQVRLWYRERHSVLRFCELTRGSTFVSAASNLAETASRPDAWRTPRRTRIHVGSSGRSWGACGWSDFGSAWSGIVLCNGSQNKYLFRSQLDRDWPQKRQWPQMAALQEIHIHRPRDGQKRKARNTRLTANAGKCELIPAISMCKFPERCLLAPGLTDGNINIFQAVLGIP